LTTGSRMLDAAGLRHDVIGCPRRFVGRLAREVDAATYRGGTTRCEVCVLDRRLESTARRANDSVSGVNAGWSVQDETAAHAARWELAKRRRSKDLAPCSAMLKRNSVS
jgi:hypothetical protein